MFILCGTQNHAPLSPLYPRGRWWLKSIPEMWLMVTLQRHAGECRETCQFLRRVNSIRPGRCPPETQATGYAALCVTACETDADCDPGALKCCSNSCGWTCQRAMHMFDGNLSNLYNNKYRGAKTHKTEKELSEWCKGKAGFKHYST